MFFTMPNHLLAFVSAFVLDLLLGTSSIKPQLSCVYSMEYGTAGNWMSKKEEDGSAWLGFAVPVFNIVAALAVLTLCFRLSPTAGFLAEIAVFSLLFNLKTFLTANDSLADAIENGDTDDIKKRLCLPGEASDNDLPVEGAAARKVSRQTAEEVVGVLFFTFLGGVVLGFLYHGLALFSREHKDYRPDKTVKNSFRILNIIPEYLCRLLIPFAGFATGKPFKASREEASLTAGNLKFGEVGVAEGAYAGALGIKIPGETADSGSANPNPTAGQIREMGKVMLEVGWTTVLLAVVVGLAI